MIHYYIFFFFLYDCYFSNFIVIFYCYFYIVTVLLWFLTSLICLPSLENSIFFTLCIYWALLLGFFLLIYTAIIIRILTFSYLQHDLFLFFSFHSFQPISLYYILSLYKLMLLDCYYLFLFFITLRAYAIYIFFFYHGKISINWNYLKEK